MNKAVVRNLFSRGRKNEKKKTLSNSNDCISYIFKHICASY